MTLHVEDHVSITSTHNASPNYGFVTRINDNNTIEVKLTIETKIRKLKRMMLMLSHYIP